MVEGVHRTYRSAALLSIGGAGLVLAVVLAAWVLLDEAGKGHWLAGVAAALWGALIGTLITEVFLRPAVSTTAEGVVLVNPFRTVVIPWGAVRDVETELALQVVTDSRRHTSWAATGNRNMSVRARALRGPRLVQSLRGGQSGAPGRSGSPSMTELLRTGASAGGITGPVECKFFIEQGLSEWSMATARAAATARAEAARSDVGGADAVDGEPADPHRPRVEWHRRWLLAAAVPAVLLLAVTLAM